jgi:hypothetical protein
MAHFAVLKGNKVIEVAVVNDQVILENGVENEQNGIDFLKTLYGDKSLDFKRTSYNTLRGIHYSKQGNDYLPSANQSKAFRYNYATVGGIYDHQKNAFIRPTPFPSFVFNSDVMDWDAPVPNTIGPSAVWDELNKKWTVPSN